MSQTLMLQNEEVTVSFNRRRGMKNITITIHDDGLVKVNRPWYVSERTALRFVERQSDWILQRLGEKRDGDPDLLTHDVKHYEKHKQDARELVLQKLAQWNALYNFSYNAVSIRRARTRWGSCSTKGNLNFNYKVIFLPEELQDYLIVHELCHLREMNHGKNFWNLVGETIPDYKILRKRLMDIYKKDID